MSDEPQDLKNEVVTLRKEVALLRRNFKLMLGVLAVLLIPVIATFPIVGVAIPATAFVVWIFFT